LQRKYKILAILVPIFVILLNIPILPAGANVICDTQTCSTTVQHIGIFERGIQCFSDCLYACCAYPVTVQSAYLELGSATTPSHQGSARLELALNNAGSSTNITGVSLTESVTNQTLQAFQCFSPQNCSSKINFALSPNSLTILRSNTTAFYVSKNISSGKVINYEITFDDGQTSAGSVTSS
jgi:hypothetical protein